MLKHGPRIWIFTPFLGSSQPLLLPRTPYPRSRGIQAHVLPGRSGGRIGTSPPPPPIGCKSRLVMEREECPSATWFCQAPNQSPHQIPFHLPPAVRRPPATASPLEDPPLPSHGDTYGGSAGTRGQDPVLFTPHPRTFSPLSPRWCQYTHICAYVRTHTLALTDAAGASAGGHCLG